MVTSWAGTFFLLLSISACDPYPRAKENVADRPRAMSFTQFTTENTPASSADDISGWDQQSYEQRSDGSRDIFGGAASSGSSLQGGSTPRTHSVFDYGQHGNSTYHMESITLQINGPPSENFQAGGYTYAYKTPFNPTAIITGNFNGNIIYPPSGNQPFPSQSYLNQMNVAAGNSNYQSNMRYMDPRQLQQQPPANLNWRNIDPALGLPSRREYKGMHMYDMIEARAESLGKTLPEFREAKATAVQKYKGEMTHRNGLFTGKEYVFVSDFFLWQSLFPEEPFPVPMMASIENDLHLYQAMMGKPATPISMIGAHSSPASAQSTPRKQNVYKTTPKKQSFSSLAESQSQFVQDIFILPSFFQRLAANLEEEKIRAAEAKDTRESRNIRNDRVRKDLTLEDWRKANE